MLILKVYMLLLAQWILGSYGFHIFMSLGGLLTS